MERFVFNMARLRCSEKYPVGRNMIKKNINADLLAGQKIGKRHLAGTGIIPFISGLGTAPGPNQPPTCVYEFLSFGGL